MLRSRILTAAALLAAFIAALFWLPPLAWAGAVAIVVGIGGWEWSRLAGLGTAGGGLYAIAIAAAATWAAGATPAAPAPEWLYWAAAAFWGVLSPLWLWERPVFRTPVLPLAAGAIVLLPGAAALAGLRAADPVLLLSVMALVWISDTAAYFVGQRIGRRKLAPAISPGKTWEGVYGALAAVSIYAIGWLALAGDSLPSALRAAPLGGVWFVILLIGLAGAGVVGDLLESQMKRQAGAKDSGGILPGHGGVLDRVDALLPVLPLAALFFLA